MVESTNTMQQFNYKLCGSSFVTRHKLVISLVLGMYQVLKPSGALRLRTIELDTSLTLQVHFNLPYPSSAE